MLNRLIGIALALGVIVVGVHAADPDLDFTKTTPLIHITYQQEHSSPAPNPYEVAQPVLNLGSPNFPCPPPTIQQATNEQRFDFVKRFILPARAEAKQPTVDAVKAKRIIADHVNKLSIIKKRYTGHAISAKTKAKLRRTTFTKMKDAHVYKFLTPHHHKSKTHHHNHHHHHGGSHHHSGGGGGHHHSGPYGPPTHIGCGP